MWAVLLEARQSRRGVPVLLLLALAGLMRPEAWALAGLYTLYLWRGASNRERLTYAGLTALAPVLWALADLAVTGDALHSLHGTADLAETADRRRDPLTGPYWAAKYLGYALREPLVIGVPIGLAFAWRHARARAWLPFLTAVAMLVVFLAGPLFGLPLIARYVRAPAVLLAVFYGLAVMGWQMLPREARDRRGWIIAGAVAALLSVAYLPWHVKLLHGRREPDRPPGRLLPRPALRGGGEGGPLGVRPLREDRHRRPPPDPAPALVDRGRPGQRRAGRHAGGARRARAPAPPPHARDEALLHDEVPARRPRRPATSACTATPPGACSPRPSAADDRRSIRVAPECT